MATLNRRRLMIYAFLTAIRPAHLLDLLAPYKDYFAQRDDDKGTLESWMRRRFTINFGEGSADAATILGMP